MKVDVLVDLQRGDCGKGKISKVLNDRHTYGIIAKYNGGGNAGHAVWIGDQKYTAHYLTSGIYDDNTMIVIGSGCVINVDDFMIEYNTFSKKFNLDGRVYIHPYAHVITNAHIEEDSKDKVIGTTGKGIGPCYADKCLRTGIRAENVDVLKPFLMNADAVRNLTNLNKPTTKDAHNKHVLMEGSQGWWLDIEHGSYPYVTSSHIHPAFAFTTFGISMNKKGNVYGVCKIYETYVGKASDLIVCSAEDDETIRQAGGEFGETTGRPRSVGYLNINDLITACNQCGVDELFVNKCDILEEVGIYKVINRKGKIKEFSNIKQLKRYVQKKIVNNTDVKMISFSGSKDGSDLK